MEPFQSNSMVVDSKSEPWQNSNSDSLVNIPDSNNSFEETDPLNLNSEVEIKQEVIDTETVSKEDQNMLYVNKIKQDIGHLDTISDVMPIDVKQEVFESENMDFQTTYADDSAKEEEEFLLNGKKLKQEIDPLDLNSGPIKVKQEIIYEENINLQTYIDASKHDNSFILINKISIFDVYFG